MLSLSYAAKFFQPLPIAQLQRQFHTSKYLILAGPYFLVPKSVLGSCGGCNGLLQML